MIGAATAALLAQMTGGDGGMGWGIAMMVAMLLVVVLVIVGVIWVVRSLLRERGGHDRDHREQPDPVRVLERRFAEGEIDIDEYRERRSILERGR